MNDEDEVAPTRLTPEVEKWLRHLLAVEGRMQGSHHEHVAVLLAEVDALRAELKAKAALEEDVAIDAPARPSGTIPVTLEYQDRGKRLKAEFGIAYENLVVTIRQHADDLEDIRKLRELLWFRHGHQGLYGDDGERQCNVCRLDFKRDSVDDIIQSFERQAMEVLRSPGPVRYISEVRKLKEALQVALQHSSHHDDCDSYTAVACGQDSPFVYKPCDCWRAKAAELLKPPENNYGT